MPKVEEEVLTEAEFEARLQWSSLGGRVSTAKEVHSRLLKVAGDYFSRGQDELAMAFRCFANEYEETVVKPSSTALRNFIIEEHGEL